MTKKIIITIFILSILAVIGYFIFWKGNEKQQPVVDTPTNDVDVVEIVKPVEVPEYIKEDQDRDGIPDTEEKALSLSTRDFDTDGDGLDDKAEIDKWKTDPTKVDTDGDSYWDGFEIMNGYNPNGEGKL